MVFDQPFRWTQPSSWPWVIWVWLAFLAAGWASSLWKRRRARRSSAWPIAQAHIESAEIDERKVLGVRLGRNRKDSIVARLSYSYSMAGSVYSGQYERQFSDQDEASEFIRDLPDKTVVVHYDPAKPTTSSVDEVSLQTLLDSRAPAPEGEAASRDKGLPGWAKPLLWPFVVLSAVGLVVSLWVHIGALTGHRVQSTWLFVALHVGIFVVWFPAVLVASRRGRGSGKWDAGMRGAPDGLKYLVYIFGIYAIVNFLFFMTQAPKKQSGNNPPPIVWRGFSGHWMVFYSAALAMLYGAASAPSTTGQATKTPAIDAHK